VPFFYVKQPVAYGASQNVIEPELPIVRDRMPSNRSKSGLGGHHASRLGKRRTVMLSACWTLTATAEFCAMSILSSRLTA
jgi:hypothetical protein